MPDFTDEQKLSIYIRGSDVLVAAAAGSGKTAVLVERIISIITDEKKPVPIDRLLIVTFTELAATEMRQRIQASIIEKLEQDPTNANLNRQAALINKSYITTIHAFCNRIIKNHFQCIDLDPSYKIADETELGLLKQEVMDDLLEEEYSNPNNENFIQLIESYNKKYNDYSIRKLILNVHKFIISSAWPEKWLLKYTQMYNLNHSSSLDDTIWAGVIKDSINLELYDALANIELGISMASSPNGPEKYLNLLFSEKDQIHGLINSCSKSFEDLFNAFNKLDFKRLPTYTKTSNIDHDLKEKVKNIRNEIKDSLNGMLAKIFFKPIAQLKEDIINLYPVMNELSRVVLKFMENYNSAKKDRNILDYNDLEHYCLKILIDENSESENITISEAAKELKNKFEEILIDEYQDSNLIQELILSSISREDVPNRFMVGDIKQSIYKFRLAKPEIFMKKYIEFSKKSLGTKIDLSKNFRSRKCIIEGINFLFYQIMTKECGELEYDENSALYYGANFPQTNLNISSSMELHLIEKNNTNSEEDIADKIQELSKIELEAAFVAKRIQKMIDGDEKLYVYDKATEQYVNCKYSDIVIIMRSVTNTGDIFVEKLKEYNIPAFVKNSDGYFETLEVLTILSLLQIIDNPLQDIHMITVLHSPIYALTCEELLQIKGSNSKLNFYNYVCDFLNNHKAENKRIAEILEKFMNDLERWRKLSTHMSISQLLWTLYSETDYLNYVGVMSGGNIRQSNLRILIEKAIQYENTSFKGLFHFIKYIERLQSLKTPMGEAKISSANENVVKIMTIHSSKGLEFPVVFVAMLGKQFNKEYSKSELILHQDLGFGPKYTDLDYRIQSSTLPRYAILKQMEFENMAEELRVLYVALTRAKEKLILTGLVDKLPDKINKWCKYINHKSIRFPGFYILHANNFLDIITPAILRHKDGNDFLKSMDFNLDFTPLSISGNSKFEIFICNISTIETELLEEQEKSKLYFEYLEEVSKELAKSSENEEISQRLSWQYENKLEANLPSKVSISEIKRLYYSEKMKDSDNFHSAYEKITFKDPEFLKKERFLTSAEIGTAIHTVMEHINLNTHTNINKIQQLLISLVQKNILSEQAANEVDLNKILKFVNSPLANRINNSIYTKKEIPFVIGLSPYEIYQKENLKDSDKTILVHGIIDCYFKEEDGIVLLDYKSDNISKKNIHLIKDRYTTQLSIYKKAIEKTTGDTVKESLLYLFSIDDFISITTCCKTC